MSESPFTHRHHEISNVNETSSLGFVYDHNDMWTKAISKELPDDVVTAPGHISNVYDDTFVTGPPDLEKGCMSCDSQSCSEPLGLVENSISVLVIRVLGVFFVILSVVEFILGLVVFNSLQNVRYGSWWTGILAFHGGICAITMKSRGWVTALTVLASLTAMISIVGAVLDGRGAMEFNGLVACTTVNPKTGNFQRYGNRNYYSTSDRCFETSNTDNNSVSDGCYCVKAASNFCHTYDPSPYVNCGVILNTYPKLLITSSAICVLITMCAGALATGSLIILCCSGKITKRQGPPPCDIIPEGIIIDVNGDEATF